MEDTAARGGGRSAAPVLTIGGELGANGGAPPVVEHPRLDLQRLAPERLAEHVESERLGGAVAGEGRSAHRCRGAVVIRRKRRGRLARAPTRTPPSPWAPGLLHRALLRPSRRWAAQDGGAAGCSAAGAAPSPSGSLANCKELTLGDKACCAEATGVTARQASKPPVNRREQSARESSGSETNALSCGLPTRWHWMVLVQAYE